MSLLDALRHRVYVALRGEAYVREVERELRFHLELDKLDGRARVPRGREQEIVPRSSLGNVTYYREEVRRMTFLHWADRVRQDARYARRGLTQSPVFSAAVILTLGLGIGVNGAMFSLLDRIFLQPPAGVIRPNELRRIYKEFHSEDSPAPLISAQMAYPQLRAFRAALDSTIAIGAYSSPESVTVRDGDVRIPARQSLVNNEYFAVLGVRAAAGRFFGLDEADIATQTPVAVISDAFWHSAFDGRREIVGKRVKITGHDVTIVGVAPPGFTGLDLDAVDTWMPANMYEGGGGGGGPWYNTFGARFQAIVRPASGAVEEHVLATGTRAIQPVQMKGIEYDPKVVLRAGPLIQALGPTKRSTEVTVATRVAGVALMVLIIACANVTNLFLLRVSHRRREIAVRQALGVTRSRLAQQFTIESVILALCGGLVALVLSLWAAAALRRLVLPRVHWATSAIDWRTAVFIAAVAIVVGSIAGVLPALHSMRIDLSNSLRAGTRAGGHRGSRMRAALVALQFALCLVLLIGAGLFIRSLSTVQSIGLGYDPANQIFIRPAFDDAVSHSEQLRVALPEAAARLRSLADVEAVAYSSVAPLQGAMFRSIYLPGRDTLPQLPGDYGPSIASVSPNFFKASGLPVRLGREFSDADQPGSEPVMVIGESLARLYWPGESALGKCILFPKRDGPCHRIVGVAADAHRMSIIEPTIGQVYLPIAQSSDGPRDLIIRARPGRSAAVIHAAELTLKPLVSGMTGVRARTFASVLEPQLRPWRLGVTLFVALGTLALVVAAIGVYSVVAYGVSQRTHEMGVRIALGARSLNILGLVLRGGLKMIAVGIATGILAALVLGRLIASLLYGVAPNDPIALAAAAILLCTIALAACLIPAWRAGRVDPVTSLRAD